MNNHELAQNTDEMKELRSPSNYFNRELSLIEFNKRVLREAQDLSHPLLERLKFACIFSSNLDEFFLIRVAGLKSQISANVVELSYDGMTPMEQLLEIRKRLIPLYKEQEDILMNDIIPSLEKHGVMIHHFDNISEAEKKNLKRYFCESVLPVLTPLTLDSAHPFPRLIDRSLNIAFLLNDTSLKISERRIAFLQLPSTLPRFVSLERRKGYHFVLVEQIIKAFADVLFPGLEVTASNTFRVTRDADIEIAEDEAEDLLSEIAVQIKQRRWGRAPVRLEVSSNMSQDLVVLLMESLDLEPIDVYYINRPLNLSDFMKLTKLEFRQLKDAPFATRNPTELQNDTNCIFTAIAKQDIMVHHPFDSFTNSVLKFIEKAADDPNVLAIKITLYRAGLNSPIVAALKRAAEAGKHVTAFVELKARFDEENNITWAKELELAGAYVVYGVIGFKTHCKIAMVVRRESGKLKTYVHLSTGNYNHFTARLYTDIGLFTASEKIAMDSIHLFNYLTGYSHFNNWEQFVVAPVNLYERTIELIRREAEMHSPENPGFIFAKMNSLAHRVLIPELYKASKKGVKIQLIVRGVCCLRPNVPGLSDNIEVRSILGRFLEHTRIFYFKNGANEEFYLSSADWMSRNLHRRVELMFPVTDKMLTSRLWDFLNLYWRDNTKSWRLQPDGEYVKIKPADGKHLFCAQDYFLREIKKNRDLIVES